MDGDRLATLLARQLAHRLKLALLLLFGDEAARRGHLIRILMAPLFIIFAATSADRYFIRQ
ncbi:hypothetical protein DK37_16225 [Halomonas sp. SUBG004]|nr:hypothetical protein DK37_16225 [Halomonas sp. SUBG004]